MRLVAVKIHNQEAGILSEISEGHYTFQYHSEYIGPAISLTMPVQKEVYSYNVFPTF